MKTIGEAAHPKILSAVWLPLGSLCCLSLSDTEACTDCFGKGLMQKRPQVETE